MKRQRQLAVYDRAAQVDHLFSLCSDFELISTASPESLRQLIAFQLIHGVILHYLVLTREQMTSIYQFKAYTAWLPVIVLADHWNLDAARQCGQIGIDALIACAEKPEKKLAAISAALRAGGFRKLLAEAGRPLTAWPLRIKNAFCLKNNVANGMVLSQSGLTTTFEVN